MKRHLLQGGLILGLAILTAVPAVAQRPSNSRYGNGARMPLSPTPPKGEPVAPFFEGWYANEDGTYMLSFGYFNLNTEEIIDLPLGERNFITPAEFDGMQPTHFPSSPRRDRGIFTVTVPSSFADQTPVVWTITANGHTLSVPGKVGYQALELDYLPRAMGSVPPIIKFAEDGAEGQHIRGLWADDQTVAVGDPLSLTVWAREVSERLDHDQRNVDIPVTVTWFKHQGPAAEVTFEPNAIRLTDGADEATTAAEFTEPGEYLLRVRAENWRANDSSGADQCCWTNGSVRVTVTGG